MKVQIPVTAQTGIRLTADSMRRVAQRPVDDEHAERHDSDLQNLARREERVALRMSAEHSAQHPRGDGEIRRAKENPRDTDGEISAEAEKQLDRQMLRPAAPRRR